MRASFTEWPRVFVRPVLQLHCLPPKRTRRFSTQMSGGPSLVFWCARSTSYIRLSVSLLHSTYSLWPTSLCSIGSCVDSASFFLTFLLVQVSNPTRPCPLTRPSCRGPFHPLIDPSCCLWLFLPPLTSSSSSFSSCLFLPQPQAISLPRLWAFAFIVPLLCKAHRLNFLWK